MRALFAETCEGTTETVVKRLDARTKFGVTALTALMTLVCGGLLSQLVLFGATLAYVLLLKRPALVALLYALTVAMMALATVCAWLIETWVPGMGGLTAKSLVVPFLRGASMMNVVTVLALSTRVEDLLRTLERLRLPFVAFLPAVVMLRFIPTFTNDIRQVWETLRIRGWPMGPGMVALHPFLVTRLVLIPILFRALKSSETLGIASELKGLGTAERTLMPEGRMLESLDARVIAAALATSGTALFMEIFFKQVLMFGSGVGMP